MVYAGAVLFTVNYGFFSFIVFFGHSKELIGKTKEKAGLMGFMLVTAGPFTPEDTKPGEPGKNNVIFMLNYS